MQHALAKKTASLLSALLIAFACCLCAGCSNEQVAATVQGEKIMEQDVSDYIETFRKGIQCEDDSAWASYLEGRELTPEEFRAKTIRELASPIIVANKAEELGITVDDSEVQEKVDDVRYALLAENDDDWQETLEYYGTDEEGMQETYRKALLRQKVLEEVIGEVTPTELDIRNYVEAHLLGQSTKKIEVLLSSDYTTLQATFVDINAAGNISAGFETAKETADEHVLRYRDLGWDVSAELTSTMASLIADLSKGQINDTLHSEDGYYFIFYVADEYSFPASIDKLGELDSSLKESISSLATEELQTAAGSVWLSNEIDENTTINAMPVGLSYDVQLRGESSQEDSGDTGDEDAKESE